MTDFTDFLAYLPSILCLLGGLATMWTVAWLAPAVFWMNADWDVSRFERWVCTSFTLGLLFVSAACFINVGIWWPS